jgi:flagellar hook-associated protein 1 FlgK
MAPGQFVTLAVSAAPGRPARTWTFEPAAAGPAFSDVLAALNAGPLAEAGEFRFERGQLHLAASGGERSLAAVSDGTRRFDTGAGFASLMGIRATTPAAGLQMKASILEAPQKFPLGLPVAAARVGERATTNGREGADVFLNEFLGQARGSQPGGVDRALAGALGNLGAIVRNADSRHADAADRASEAQDRRDGFSGVNIDEEMALMMVLQNSYAASARVLTAVQSMADTLLGMLR